MRAGSSGSFAYFGETPEGKTGCGGSAFDGAPPNMVATINAPMIRMIRPSPPVEVRLWEGRREAATVYVILEQIAKRFPRRHRPMRVGVGRGYDSASPMRRRQPAVVSALRRDGALYGRPTRRPVQP